MTLMDRQRQRQELEEKLANCHRLAGEYTDGITAQNLRQIAAEIEQQLRDLDESASPRPRQT
jgi:hypothetical protein